MISVKKLMSIWFPSLFDWKTIATLNGQWSLGDMATGYCSCELKYCKESNLVYISTYGDNPKNHTCYHKMVDLKSSLDRMQILEPDVPLDTLVKESIKRISDNETKS